MTMEETKAVLIKAHEYLEGEGATLPGARAAKWGIASLGGPVLHNALPARTNAAALVDMIVSEGEFARDPSIPVAQHMRDLLEAASNAVKAATST